MAEFIPQAHQIREDRSLLLDYINSVYPESMAEDDLLDVMVSLPNSSPPDHTRRDLAYLEARGLIEPALQQRPGHRTPVKRWKLTAKGLTFVEHNKPWAELEAM